MEFGINMCEYICSYLQTIRNKSKAIILDYLEYGVTLRWLFFFYYGKTVNMYKDHFQWIRSVNRMFWSMSIFVYLVISSYIINNLITLAMSQRHRFQMTNVYEMVQLDFYIIHFQGFTLAVARSRSRLTFVSGD